MRDNLTNLYEQMIEKELKDIEIKQPTLIEQMQVRIKTLEEAVEILKKRIV